MDKILQKSEISLNTGTFYNKTQRQFVIESLQDILFTEYKAEWKNKVMSNVSIIKNNGGNKLRTYKLFKEDFEKEPYVKNHIMSRAKRDALAFRCGVTPLCIETGRYKMIPYDKRNSFNCITKLENEEHVLLEYPLYKDIRLELFSKIVMPSHMFDALSNPKNVRHLLPDSRIINYSAKACHDILSERRKYLYS